MAKFGENVSEERIAKEAGYLYFLGKDGYVYKAALKHGLHKGEETVKVGSEKVVREAGYLYYIGKDGGVWRSKMKVGRRKA